MSSAKKSTNGFCGCQRRHFLRIFFTGTITLPWWLQFTQIAQASGQPKALVLSCIDFRFVNFEQTFLLQKKLDNQYDWLALAGASLALSDFPSQAETQTFWEQLDLSYRLHKIEKVIILDHQDCGAYESKIDNQLSQNPKREEQVHRQYLNQAYSSIKERYPNLEVELYFIKLDGQVQAIIPTTLLALQVPKTLRG
jgi:hypothetical protein